MRLHVLVVVCLSTLALPACEGAVWSRTEVKPPPLPPPAARWEQYCTFFGSGSLEDINAFLHDQGAAGWELVALGGKNATVYCFKARVPPP